MKIGHNMIFETTAMLNSQARNSEKDMQLTKVSKIAKEPEIQELTPELIVNMSQETSKVISYTPNANGVKTHTEISDSVLDIKV